MFQDYTILLVEDDKVMQEYIDIILRDSCKELFFANNGVEGLEQYQKHRPDLIITDLNMPIMDGIEMSKHIKTEDFTQPIILLTAYGDIKELQEAINIGLNAFLSKPVENKEILFKTIAKLLMHVNKVKSHDEHKADSVVNDLLHNNQEYVDYESLILDVR